MAEFITKYSSTDFDKAMDGGFKFANGEFLSPEQMALFIANGNLATKDELGGGSSARIGEVTLNASSWTGEGYLFSQIVTIDGVTENTQVDLTPSVEQLAIFYEKDIAFVTENEDGVVTVYVIGQKPQNDYTIQVTMTEVAYG